MQFNVGFEFESKPIVSLDSKNLTNYQIYMNVIKRWRRIERPESKNSIYRQKYIIKIVSKIL